ncbi:hypothetical protein CQW23_03515 [Capsicum baccatum]|uniref:RNase H type-1 domain-containing protein n=1 Tax=Capsicum baccatum TaxID=33114 RepID=A0A2G2XC54_CAPBA|nr:hypothetical protein CQW23_03515 [Capsicum baccatum]
MVTRPGNIKVSQFLIDGRWNEEMIRQHAPPLLVPQILTTRFHFQDGVDDIPIWKPNESGTFTFSSAWELVRAKKERTRLHTNTWHRNIPFKVSFLLWRALRGKLPTNDRIAQFGSTLVDCFCCNRTAAETIDHVFVSGHFARHIWQFSALARINRRRHDVKVTSITWIKPAADFYKLNTDGSALQNPGSIGGGGILRDHHGNLIYAFSTPFGIGTNNQAEVKAAIFGVAWCIQHGYTKLILEVDSDLLIKWLTHHIQPPWRLDTDLRELQNLVSQLESFQSRHVHREANYTADALSKYSHHYDITQHYYTHQQLPRAAKGFFILEKLGTMNFRRRKLKRIKKPP